jgi:hypothetical protein
LSRTSARARRYRGTAEPNARSIRRHRSVVGRDVLPAARQPEDLRTPDIDPLSASPKARFDRTARSPVRSPKTPGGSSDPTRTPSWPKPRREYEGRSSICARPKPRAHRTSRPILGVPEGSLRLGRPHQSRSDPKAVSRPAYAPSRSIETKETMVLAGALLSGTEVPSIALGDRSPFESSSSARLSRNRSSAPSERAVEMAPRASSPSGV